MHQIKKLSKHDFIISGKRFQIKTPPVLTISNSTQISEIVVKVGISPLNFKEFLLSIINEKLQLLIGSSENPDGDQLSDAVTSQYSRLRFGSNVSSNYTGTGSLYGLGLGIKKNANKN